MAKVTNNIVGKMVSFFWSPDDSPCNLIEGRVTKFLGDGIKVDGLTYWFADMAGFKCVPDYSVGAILRNKK